MIQWWSHSEQYHHLPIVERKVMNRERMARTLSSDSQHYSCETMNDNSSHTFKLSFLVFCFEVTDIHSGIRPVGYTMALSPIDESRISTRCSSQIDSFEYANENRCSETEMNHRILKDNEGFIDLCSRSKSLWVQDIIWVHSLNTNWVYPFQYHHRPRKIGICDWHCRLYDGFCLWIYLRACFEAARSERDSGLSLYSPYHEYLMISMHENKTDCNWRLWWGYDQQSDNKTGPDKWISHPVCGDSKLVQNAW
jgi:hypothetical protein